MWVEDPETGKAMGNWRKPKASERAKELVGKKVKIYFEGNYSYLEAEVYDYDPSTNKHDVKYTCDDEEAKELLDHSVPGSSDFLVFDESLAPTEIKKRHSVGNR